MSNPGLTIHKQSCPVGHPIKLSAGFDPTGQPITNPVIAVLDTAIHES